jgi:Kef-type K+ transport system membrane component KefB
MVIVRGIPTYFIFRRRFDARSALAAGSLEATSLTFPVIAVTIGEGLHFVSPGTAAAMVTAGLLSVIILPAAALAMRPWTLRRTEPAPT